MRALVTGAAGFVGANLVRELLRDGVEVRAMVRKNGDLRNLADLDVEIATGDLTDAGSLAPLLRGCDVLYHVAALYGEGEAAARLMYAINAEGTRNILRAAQTAGVSRVVHTSTIGTIGRPANGENADESVEFNLWATSSHYARSKYMGERIALEMAHMGLPVVVVNPCAPVGKYDIKPSSTGRRVVDYLEGRMPSFLEGGINFIDVEDVARGHILAARNGTVGERYILGNVNLSLKQFLQLMREVSGQKAPNGGDDNPLRQLARRILKSTAHSSQPHLHSLTCDCSKAIRELSLSPTPIRFSLAKAVQWFRDNGYIQPRHSSQPAARTFSAGRNLWNS